MNRALRRAPMPVVRRLAVLLAALAALVFAQPAGATFPGKNGLITFAADSGSGFQLYTVQANGHNLRQITHVSGDAANPDWSPDGSRIVFEVNSANGGNIAIVNADGSHLVNLPVGPGGCCEGQPSYTPDGKQIVFEAFIPATGDDAIWSMNVDGSHRQRLIGPWPNGFATDPNVSPDGETLSFVGTDGSLVGPPPLFEAALGLFTSSIDGSNLRQLLPFTSDLAIKQDWAPDGRHLVATINANFFHPGESANIATIRPNGTDLHYLTHYSGGAVNAYVGSYSPDGKWIVFRLEDHGSYTLQRMRTDGTDLQTILGPSSSFRPRYIDWGPRAQNDNSGPDQGGTDQTGSDQGGPGQSTG